MMTEARTPSENRSLLGLRPPADLAEEALAGLESPPSPAGTLARPVVPPRPPQNPPPQRPDYSTVSTAIDAEEAKASQGSDLMAAMRAGVVLVGLMVALGLLISG